MTRIRIAEGAGWEERELSAEGAATLGASQVVQVMPGPRQGLWKIRDNGLVGAARIGPSNSPIDVSVEPKISIDRLFFLLGYALSSRGWRRQEVDAGERADLLPALAYAFARTADRALRQGVLLGYREVEMAQTVVRGRIRVTDQIRRRYGVPIPIEVRYDDYTVDIAENRLLLGAAQRLRCLPGVPVETRKVLHHLLVRLDGVEAPVPGSPLPRWHPSRLNDRYRTALGLAELVLRGASYELDDGTSVRVDGLLMRMWQVFEDFLTAALSDALRPYGGRSELQDRSYHLDHARRLHLRPDLVYYDATGAPRAVVDAKYKVDRPYEVRQEDLYQMLAYCTVMGLDRGHLVYAAGGAEPTTHAVQRAGIEIVIHALDLDRAPADLLAQISTLAMDVVDTGTRLVAETRARR